MVLPFRPHASPGVIQALGERVLPSYEAHLKDRGCSPGLFHRSMPQGSSKRWGNGSFRPTKRI